MKDWKNVILGDCIEIKNGQVDPRIIQYSEMILIAPNHIESSTGRITYKETSIEQNAISGKYLVNKGDVIYSKIRPYLMKVAIAEEGCLCSADMYPINGKSTIINRYLFYLLLSDRFTQFAISQSGRTGIPKINREELNEYIFPLPPLPEQKKIAQILSIWDRAIELLEKKIAAKEKLKKGLMQKLLTGALRLRSATGQPFGPPAKKGELPEGWKEVRLGDVFSERVETGYNNLPLLSVTSEQGIINRNELDKKDTSNSDKSKYLRICPGDIGYNTMRMWQGRSAVSTLEGIISPAYTVVIPKPEIDIKFAGYLFKFPMIIHRFWRYSQGLVDDTLNCKFNSFSRVLVYLPSVNEQQKVGIILEKIENNIKILIKHKDKIIEQKKGLMQLLIGKVRVKVKYS